ncbi:MAG TPA: dihydrofolate reductase [Patescibacteria group bacterium]|nr:dihydrofolate reductase [Patescibacteria group bacterium]
MYHPHISIFAAMSENRVIGNGNVIPWHITPDLKRLSQKCQQHTVILGRKTYESMDYYYGKYNKELPGKHYIIITSDKLYSPSRANTFVVHSFEEALQKAKEIEPDEIIIAGGQRVFTESLPFVDRLYLTLVKGNYEGDAFFPDYSEFTKVVEKEDQTYKEYSYTFLTLER